MKKYVATHLKDMNRKKVYDLLVSSGELSRAEISRKTGISSPTVLRIVDYLLENNFVIELGEGDSSLGRKPKLLKFNSKAAFAIGVEIEGDFLKVGIADLLGNILHAKIIKVTRNFDEIINHMLYDAINNMIHESKIPHEKIIGIGIGISGVIDPISYSINYAPYLGIHSKKNCKDIIEMLSKKIGLPVIIENDVNSAAWGEYIHRKMNSTMDLLYVSLGTGLGGGLILDGKIRRGTHFSAGEIGYMLFDMANIPYISKADRLEERININALSQKWESFEKLLQDHCTQLKKEEKNNIIEYLAGYLAISIVNIVNVIDVSYVVLGGVTIKALGNPLIEKVNKYLKSMSLVDVTCSIHMCREPGVVGAASIAMNTYLKLY